MEQLNTRLFHRDDRVHRMKKNLKIDLSFFRNPRWQLINFLEQLSGFWPYQSKLQQYSLQLFHSVFSLTVQAASVNELCKHIGTDAEMTIECCLNVLFVSGLYIKMLYSIIYQNSRRKVYERIAKHFEVIVDPEELAVLNEGAEQGFIYTLYYVCIICVLVFTFDSIPVIQALHDYYFNHLELQMQLPLPMDFGLDHSKYWYIVAIDFGMWACTGTLVNFAFDMSFMLQIRHVVALFEIVGIRLRKASELVDEFENEAMSDDAADEAYSIISSAIDLHAETLELIELIEDAYSTTFFTTLVLSAAGFGAGIHLISTKLHDPIETFRYSSVFAMVIMYFQVVFSRGQLITDSAEGIFNACYDCKWYGLPKKSCNLLSLMMIRTSIPCMLTGAKLFPLSMESFSKMLKASLSYYTVFEAK